MSCPRSARLPSIRVLALLILPLLVALPPVARADDPGGLRLAMRHAWGKDWGEAAAQARATGPLAQSIVEWQRLRSGEGLLGDYESFLAHHADWPGLKLLRSEGEEAVARSTTPSRVIAYFGSRAPATAMGAIALARALAGTGRPAEAEAVIRRAWTSLAFDPEEEALALSSFPDVLARSHEERLDMLLWQNRPEQARRMLPRVSDGWKRLAAARLALRADADGVDGLIAAVPPALADHPGLAYERFLWRSRKGRDAEAAALMLERSRSVADLGDPEQWAGRRAGLARAMNEEGDPKTAYRLAASHHLEGGADFAELEFFAGFVALRKLDDAETALAHFRRLQAAVRTPISLSRALYWQGRALEALGRYDEAGAAFAAGARHQTAYYGLLSAERAGIAMDPALIAPRAMGDWRQAGFASSSVLAAGRLLLAAGERDLGKRFLLHLAESLDEGDLDRLAGMALEMGEPHVAVLIAKQAADRGIILPHAYFPVPDLVPPDGLPVSRALALSIARRESEFNPVVVSPAGARGLMQVMPGTAKLISAKVGVDYELRRLTGDPAYNVRLGTAYLAQLVEEFGPSLALVASGYNAGPGRPRRWIAEFGDPRQAHVDAVDWVEQIPFSETRTYVMRVTESVVIYRAKLRGAAGAVRITPELKG
ncbi:transglycosylase SLT domain-containing protein [Cereibacter sphaeroides]|uniref:lytic transglycosylase domain-containing protein n=1 Tax=Cereibacter sphaeroides TaxID=1063 RepID=UPI001F2E319D|nr:transglycosylase SLT domain-containing protein [Cereibacter sphaeroides]MCE6959919.1 transglycosylase SLT domain-containing protein [Cereibacter sphaeroides]MCE6973004.1 transglycosylase SLT domain-containing protein [Cereibacter sphaeroides]